jgi:hypothetical protein
MKKHNARGSRVKFLSWSFDWNRFWVGLVVGIVIMAIVYGAFVTLALNGAFTRNV